MTDKAALRRHIAALEKAVPEAELAAGDRAMTEKILTLPEYCSASRIFVFYGVGREPDTRPILAHALAAGKTVSIPYIVSEGVMQARVLRDLESLIPGRYNIPTTPETEVLAPEELDFLLVPGAAFDGEGHRLGRGGGYYDRFLAGASGVKVGLVRDFALLEAVPTQAHDCRVDFVVTDKKIARPR